MLRVVFVVASLVIGLWQAVVLTFLGRASTTILSPRWLGARVSAVRAYTSLHRGVLCWVGAWWWTAARTSWRLCAPEDSEPPSAFGHLESFTFRHVCATLFNRLVLAAVLRAASFGAVLPCVTALRHATAIAVIVASMPVAVVREGKIEDASVWPPAEARSLTTRSVTVGNRGESGQGTGQERRP